MICCNATYWVLIRQNFFYFNRGGKILSDKAAICSPSQIPPAPWASTLQRAIHDGIRFNAPGKDRIILARQLKQKGSRSYATPTAFTFFNI
jgi:hypothetical protein